MPVVRPADPPAVLARSYEDQTPSQGAERPRSPTDTGRREWERRHIVWRRRCHRVGMSLDPVSSNPDHDEVVFENERVRVLEYTDQPGERTTPHRHPDSVMYTVSRFERRLVSGGTQREVAIEAGAVGWLPAQEHSGENIRNTRHT